MPEGAQSGGVRELRLAVVLYGGVSLAIYMHGMTKELHRLVKASALEDQSEKREGDTPSERVYQRLLRCMRDHDERHVRTRVVVDVIAGTSAGGVNGIYLAKALAHNRSQDGLRDVWLERGDIDQLLRGPRRIPWQVRAVGQLLQLRTTSPLNGEALSRWLYEALEAMDAGPPAASQPSTLMPDGHQLELFVTATDFAGYDRELVIKDPRLVRDRAHRHVLRFRHGDGEDDFGPEDNGWLAFAARVTSSFPGAFPPVTLREFQATVQPSAGLPRPERFFRIYQLSHASADECFFVDGGILDNRPFDHVIRSIRHRTADVEVDRRLLYLEPDPAGPREPDNGKPGPIATALGSVAGIPQQQPILDAIVDVTRHNDRVRALRDLIEMAFERRRGTGADGHRDRSRAPREDAEQRRSRALEREAAPRCGGGGRLRVSDVPSDQGERRRGPVRANGLRALRLSRGLQPSRVRAHRPAHVGPRAPGHEERRAAEAG